MNRNSKRMWFLSKECKKTTIINNSQINWNMSHGKPWPPWKTHYCLHVHKKNFKEYKIMNKSTKWTFVRKCRVEIQFCGPTFLIMTAVWTSLFSARNVSAMRKVVNAVINLTVVAPFRCDSTWPQPIVCHAVSLMYLGPHL